MPLYFLSLFYKDLQHVNEWAILYMLKYTSWLIWDRDVYQLFEFYEYANLFE